MANAAADRTDPPWPRDARAACAFTFDLDAETLWMARGVSEPVALSQGRFGVLEACPRILAMLRAAEIRASFFIPAWVAEHYPDSVKAIAGAGPRDRLPRRRARARERAAARARGGDPPEEPRRADAARRAAARPAIARPRGSSRRTRSRCSRADGFEYSSNMMDRLAPYLHPPIDGRALVEIPVSWVLDDAPYFLFTGQRAIQAPGPGAPGLAHRVRRHHRGPRRHQLHVPPADHRPAVAPRVPARTDRPRAPHAAPVDRAAGARSPRTGARCRSAATKAVRGRSRRRADGARDQAARSLRRRRARSRPRGALLHGRARHDGGDARCPISGCSATATATARCSWSPIARARRARRSRIRSGKSHHAFLVDWERARRARGGSSPSAACPHHAPIDWGDHQCLYFLDPDGNLLELVGYERRRPTGPRLDERPRRSSPRGHRRADRRILVIHPGALGDVLQAVPALRGCSPRRRA